MINFIIENKEWLFSGIGVIILLGIFALVKKAFHSEKAPFIMNRKRIEEDNSIFKIPSLTFSHIEKLVNNAPPLQRDEIKNSFKGIKVNWETYLNSASKEENFINLRLKIGANLKNEDLLYTIHCKVASNDYPQLGVLLQSTKIIVKGEIDKVSTQDIELVNVKLTFPD